METKATKMPGPLRADAYGEAACTVAGTAGDSPVDGIDCVEILRSAGEAAYGWRI